jgi:CheY-like chemotaxis protein/tetratricopeptide (TPR) repeat protein
MPARILIVEDHDPIAAAVEGLLARQGLAAERARDGVEALGRIVRNPPDLLLLDLKLPRLHGIELLKKLRQSPRTSGLPVIVMTGAYRGEQYARAARSLGVAAWLEKPFRAAELLAAVRQALPAPAAAASSPAAQTVDHHLRRAFISRFCGRLVLRGEKSEHSVTFISGTPVFVRPGFAYHDFGDWLHRRGFLSAEEYAWYAGPGQLRHELPVQMGCIAYPDLLEEKLAYLSAELVAAFGFPPLAAEEHPFAPPPGLQLLTVNVPQLFLQGYRRHCRPEARRQLLDGCGARYAATAPDFFRYVNFLALGTEEKRFLGCLDGTRRLADCLRGEEDLVPLALTLQTLGMVRFAATPLEPAAAEGFPQRALFNAVAEEVAPVVEAPLESFADLIEDAAAAAVPPAAAPPALPAVAAAAPPAEDLSARVRQTLKGLQGKNHYQVFGMTQGQFSFDRLKERYFALTRQFGPEVLMQLGGEEAALAEEILAIVATAYNTLSDVVRKESYDQLLGADKVGLGQQGDDRFQAQVQAQSGKVFIEMAEWDNAERALQDACTIDPDSGDYLAHLAWAIYRNPKSAASRAVQEKARQMLNRALTLERTADGFAFKGWMLFEAGQDGLAEGEFGKALKLDARQMLARKGLRAIQEKRDQDKKGLFRRMFS